MKYVKLLATAYVNGKPRHPHEGALHLEDDEAKRLVDGGLAVDVTEDFAAKDNKAAPVESITVNTGEITDLPREPHQSEVAPQAVEDAPAADKAATSKE